MRLPRKERQRVERQRKRKEAVGRRQSAKPFVATFRRLVETGWIGGSFRDLVEGECDAEVLRRGVDSACSGIGCRPGDAQSWQLLVDILEDREAPESVLDPVIDKWQKTRPDDPRPRVLRIRKLLLAGRHGDAARAAEEMTASSASRELRQELADHCGRFGIDLDALLAWHRRPRGPRMDTRQPKERSRPRVRPASRPPERGRGSRGHDSASRGARSPAHAPRSPEPLGDARDGKPQGTLTTTAPEISEAAAITFDAFPGDDIVERLLKGPHDSVSALDLARRAARTLAEDRYDRLLSLAEVHGVEHLGYQIETVLRVLKRFRGRVLLADEVGLGKTIEACLLLKEYLLRGQVKKALVLVPSALVGQWKAELEEKFGIVSQTTEDPIFRRDPEAFWAGGPVLLASLSKARSAAHRPILMGRRFDMVIVDEAHHLKNRATRCWELVNGLRSRFLLMLTATPVETNLKELYNLVTLLRPGTLGTEAEFRRRFVSRADPAQPSDPEKLRELLREVMVRNTRALCGVVLAPRTARTLVVRPTPGEEALYALILEGTRRYGLVHRTLFRVLMEQAGSSPLSVAETAARAALSPARLESDPSDGESDKELARALSTIEEAARAVDTTAKLQQLARILHGGKVLVFSRFRGTMRQIAADLSRRGVRFTTFRGGMTSAEKDRAVQTFAGSGIDVMLCSEVGGEGRNLQFCHRLINFDLPWNPMKIEQRIGRIHRIGQTETVEVLNLACAGTAEERILDVLDRRVNLFELVVGEMDLLLGDLEDERDFGEQVFDIYAESRSEQDVDRGFERLAGSLFEARGRLEKTKALDETLFGEGYEA